MRCLRILLREVILNNVVCMLFVYIRLIKKRSTSKVTRTTTRATHANEQNSSMDELLVAFPFGQTHKHTHICSSFPTIDSIFSRIRDR